MRAVLSVGAVLMLLGTCVADEGDTGRIEVHVSVATRAVVVLTCDNEVKAVSVIPKDMNGCLLEGIAAGRYKLAVSAPFYASATRTVTVRAGEETELTVVLARLTQADYRDRGRIVGYVKDANGDPLVNATLVLMKATRPMGAARPENATGVYELEWYPPGTYKVIVTAERFATRVYAGQKITAGASTRLDVVLEAE